MIAANYFKADSIGNLEKANFINMKIKFKKFEATNTFIKLFRAGRGKSDTHTPEVEETDDAYEYYYKRGNTYYFRNSAGDKFSIDYTEPQKELTRGSKYKMDAINNRNS